MPSKTHRSPKTGRSGGRGRAAAEQHAQNFGVRVFNAVNKPVQRSMEELLEKLSKAAEAEYVAATSPFMAQIDDLGAELGSCKEDLGRAEKTIEKQAGEISDWKRRVTELEATNRSLVQENAEARGDLKRLKGTLSAIRGAVEDERVNNG